MEQQFKNLLSIMKQYAIDGVLISSATNIAYLTNFHGFSLLQRDGYLLATQNSVFLITSALYRLDAEKIKGVQTRIRSSEQSTKRIIEDICRKEKLSTIGIEENNLTVAEYNEFLDIPVTFKPINLRTLRKSKTEEEISLISHATKLSFQALEKVRPLFLPGVTEVELSQKIELEMKKLGVDPSFPTIVAFGENAAVPHHIPDNTKLKTKDVILIDFGVRYLGYCSDTTRTFFIGDVPKTWKTIFEIVEKSQELAVEFINRQLAGKQEIHVCDVDKVARNYITEKGYPNMPHSLGHGIGLEVHEFPTLSPYAKDLLTEGMVFSIEPGIYLPGEMGVRIEDLFSIVSGSLIKIH